MRRGRCSPPPGATVVWPSISSCRPPSCAPPAMARFSRRMCSCGMSRRTWCGPSRPRSRTASDAPGPDASGGARRSRRDAVAAADRCAIALSVADDRPCQLDPVRAGAGRRNTPCRGARAGGDAARGRRSCDRHRADRSHAAADAILPIQRDITSTKKKWSDRVRVSSARCVVHAGSTARRMSGFRAAGVSAPARVAAGCATISPSGLEADRAPSRGRHCLIAREARKLILAWPRGSI